MSREYDINVMMNVIKDEPCQEKSEINSTCEETAAKIEPVEPKQEEELNFFFTKQDFQLNDYDYVQNGVSLKLELNDSTTSSNDQVLNPLQIQTRNSTTTEFKCQECNYVTKWKQDLVRHTKAHHGSENLKCQKCSFTTKLKRYLMTHAKVHHGSEEFKCHQCNYVTKAKEYLVKHMKVHHSSEKFECAQCNYATKWKQNLLQHVKVCHSSEKFECQKCNFTTKWKGALVRHGNRWHCLKDLNVR